MAYGDEARARGQKLEREIIENANGIACVGPTQPNVQRRVFAPPHLINLHTEWAINTYCFI